MSIQDEGLTETGILQRCRLFESMGYPASPAHMDQTQYERLYTTRQTFINRQVFHQVQSMLRTIFCPSCITEDPAGRITGTRLYASVEDDVMTTFKAMLHFTCHHCGFDEYHPLAKDPRANQAGMSQAPDMPAYAKELAEMQVKQRRFEQMQQQAAQIGAVFGSAGLAQAAQAGLGLGDIRQMVPPKPTSPIPGATDEEQTALQRLINRAYKSRKP